MILKCQKKKEKTHYLIFHALATTQLPSTFMRSCQSSCQSRIVPVFVSDSCRSLCRISNCAGLCAGLMPVLVPDFNSAFTRSHQSLYQTSSLVPNNQSQPPYSYQITRTDLLTCVRQGWTSSPVSNNQSGTYVLDN